MSQEWGDEGTFSVSPLRERLEAAGVVGSVGTIALNGRVTAEIARVLITQHFTNASKVSAQPRRTKSAVWNWLSRPSA